MKKEKKMNKRMREHRVETGLTPLGAASEANQEKKRKGPNRPST